MFKQAEQKQENKTVASKGGASVSKGGAPLIAVSIFLAGATIAVAVLVKDKIELPLGADQKEPVSVEEQKGSAEGKLVTVPENGAPSLGENGAPVVVYEISDFACPYCALASGFGEEFRKQLIKVAREQGNDSLAEYWESVWVSPLPQIKEKYVNAGKVRLVFKAIPGHGQPSVKASEASLCAGDQGKFWEYHDKLFAEQSDWYQQGVDTDSLLTKFATYAGELSLNEDAFKRCLEEETHSKEVMDGYSDSQEVLKQLKENKLVPDRNASIATPTYIINGRYLAGAQSFSEFEKIIEEELNK